LQVALGKTSFVIDDRDFATSRDTNKDVRTKHGGVRGGEIGPQCCEVGCIDGTEACGESRHGHLTPLDTALLKEFDNGTNGVCDRGLSTLQHRIINRHREAVSKFRRNFQVAPSQDPVDERGIFN
jgi:hypothetical protein